jgi:LysM repeat protein
MITKLHTSFIVVIALTVGILLFTPSETSAQQPATTHTVQAGETLFSIARQYDLAVGDLRRWNELESDNLSVGQTLRIAPPRADNQITHTVEPGETLFSVSRRYNVTIAEIQQWNNLETTNLSLGQELTIFRPDDSTSTDEPQLTETEVPEVEEERESIIRQSEGAAPNTYYTVRSGDSLFRIANQHGLSVDELKQLNNLETDMLRVGQRLTVPSERSSAPSVAEEASESTPQGKFVQYRVQSGETGQAILNKFNMSESELFALNPGLSMNQISSGQLVTVLLPPTRSFENPYRTESDLENLGSVSVFRYSGNDVANPTTSGELYNPDQLTAAHPNIALGKVVYIENPSNNNGIFVKINDRHSGDGLKLSTAAYDMLSFSSVEQARVTIYLDQ